MSLRTLSRQAMRAQAFRTITFTAQHTRLPHRGLCTRIFLDVWQHPGAGSVGSCHWILWPTEFIQQRGRIPCRSGRRRRRRFVETLPAALLVGVCNEN